MGDDMTAGTSLKVNFAGRDCFCRDYCAKYWILWPLPTREAVPFGMGDEV